MVYQKLKAFLIDLPKWAWIEPHNMAGEDDRAAYMAWNAMERGVEQVHNYCKIEACNDCVSLWYFSRLYIYISKAIYIYIYILPWKI
jgi:hypothetical protein